MNRTIVFLTLLLAICPVVSPRWSTAVAQHDIIIEAAEGFASPVSPVSSKWEGAVKPGGLFYREFAARGTYRIHMVVSARITIGWLEDYSRPVAWFARPPEFPQPQPSFRDVYYLIPSVTVSLRELRFDFGTVIYHEDITRYDYWYDDYPFDGVHRFKPSIGLELGERGAFIFGRLSDSFPLISGGGILEAGIGGRVDRLYEHKVSCSLSNYHYAGLGYRGEFRIFRQNALSFGLLIGGKDRDNVYAMTIGIKTVIPGR